MNLSTSDLEVRRWAAELIDDEDWNVETVSQMDAELLVERLCSKLAETDARFAESQELLRLALPFPGQGLASETLPDLLDSTATRLDKPTGHPGAHDTTFRRLVVEALDGVSVVAFDWNLQTGEMRFTRPGDTVPWSRSELTGGSFADFCAAFHGEDRDRFLEELADALRTSKPLCTEHRIRLADGSFSWARIEARSLNAEGRDSPYLVGILIDISDFRKITEDFAESEERYRQMFEDAPVMLAVFDRETPAVLAANRAGCEHYGYTAEEFSKLSVQELYVPEEWPQVVKALSRFQATGDEAPYRGVWRHRKKSGEVFHVELRTASVVFRGRKARLVVGIDVTEKVLADEERSRLEPNLRQMQKLESLGVLAGGIAHDFNNLLTGILGNADLALLETTESGVIEYLEQIEIAARRAAELTRQLLAYSGKGRFIVQPIVVSDLVDEMAKLLEISISKKVTLRREFAENLPAIEADVSQIRQVLMNLIINASEAHGEQPGEIVVRTGSEFCKREYLDSIRTDDRLPEQEYVWLEVQDSGSGMEETTQSRIFDPFYTTKFAGRGLGLSATQGIVRSHRGAIVVDTKPGVGTCIRVLLPAAGRLDAKGPDVWAKANGFRGTGTVLVVDDESFIRNLATTMLERAGFQVLAASDGIEAVAIFEQRFAEIRAVVLDMTMPRMDGAETFRELRRIDPSVRILLSSGYSEQEANLRFAGRDISGFIEKPYRSEQLLNALKKVIEVA